MLAALEMLQHPKMVHKSEGVPSLASHEFLEDKKEVPPLSQQGATRNSFLPVYLHILINDETLPVLPLELLIFELLLTSVF